MLNKQFDCRHNRCSDDRRDGYSNSCGAEWLLQHVTKDIININANEFYGCKWLKFARSLHEYYT